MLAEKLAAKKPKKDFTSSYSELKTKEMLMTNELKVQELELAKRLLVRCADPPL